MATSLIPVTYTTHVNPPMPSGQRRAGPEAQTRSNVGANAKVGRVENIVRNRFPQDLPTMLVQLQRDQIPTSGPSRSSEPQSTDTKSRSLFRERPRPLLADASSYSKARMGPEAQTSSNSPHIYNFHLLRKTDLAHQRVEPIVTPTKTSFNESNTASPSKTKPCYAFKDGRCRLGSNCAYSHDLDIIFASIGQQTSETRPLSSNPPNTTPQNFEHQIRFTGAPQNISQRSEVCHDWMRGKCSRTPCRFRHSEENKTTQVPPRFLIERSQGHQHSSQEEVKINNFPSTKLANMPVGKLVPVGIEVNTKSRQHEAQPAVGPDANRGSKLLSSHSGALRHISEANDPKPQEAKSEPRARPTLPKNSSTPRTVGETGEKAPPSVPHVSNVTCEDVTSQKPATASFFSVVQPKEASKAPQKTRLCCQWMLNKCFRSGDCSYFHDPELSGVLVRFQDPRTCSRPGKTREYCRSFLFGESCSWGDKCRHIHDEKLAQMVKARTSILVLSEAEENARPQQQTEEKDTLSPDISHRSSKVVESVVHSSPATSLASTMISDSSSEASTLIDGSHPAHPPPQQLPSVQLKTTPCLNWKDGRCSRGDNCFYFHDPKAPELERIRREHVAKEEATMTTERLVFGYTRVTFGAGLSIKDIVTGFDSCRVLVKNLPLDAQRHELQDLFTQPGFDPEHFRIITLRTSADGIHQEASVIFDKADDGKHAIIGLDGVEFRDEVLKLAVMTSGQMGPCGRQSDSITLTLKFKTPSMRALAIYPSKEIASARAHTLDNDFCGGRQVRVALNQQPAGRAPLRQFIPNAVIINGLSVDVASEEIQRFSECFSMRLFPPRKFNVEEAVRRLRVHMKTVGGMKNKDFELVETPNYAGTVEIHASFDTWKGARAVVDSLSNQELEYLDGSRVTLHLPHPYQYSTYVPILHYESQITVFSALIADHANDDDAQIIVSREVPHYFLRIVGCDKKAVGSLKVRIERLAAGETINHWDRFFLTSDGCAFLGRLYKKTRAFVLCDRRLNVLKAFGEPEAVEVARKEVKKEVDRLASMEYGINLKSSSIRFFIRTGVAILKEMVGEDNINFHTSSFPFRITVRGGEKAVHALKKLVDESQSNPIRSGSDPKKQCPLCFEDPINPFPLTCGHLYCNGCVLHLITSASDGRGVPLCCIGNENRCKTLIPIPVIERFLPPARFKQFFENAFRAHVDKHPQKLRYCATPDCPQIYRVTKGAKSLQCPSCFAEVCSRCHAEGHEGISCAEWATRRDPKEQERLLRRWAKGNSNVKRCPECRIFIEKVEGCNHIRCLCGAHVCWICRKSFNNGIYDHLTEVHGGAFDLPT